jgi:hypothetical protein
MGPLDTLVERDEDAEERGSLAVTA